MESKAPRSTSTRLFAALLSFLIPGLGQLVQGRRKSAALFFLAALVLYTAIFFVSMLVTQYVVPWWVQGIGIGWNFISGIEALVHVPAGSGMNERTPSSTPASRP